MFLIFPDTLIINNILSIFCVRVVRCCSHPGGYRTKPVIPPLHHPTPSTAPQLADHKKKLQKTKTVIGYEPHLVDIIEKDILQRNPNVQWDRIAGLKHAKTLLQEAMVLPMLMPDFFKVYKRIIKFYGKIKIFIMKNEL